MNRSEPQVALQQLRQAAERGELAFLCDQHGVDLVVAFGSAVRSVDDAGPAPRDLDVAVLGGHLDIARIVVALQELAGSGTVDVLDLGRAGVVARGLALEVGEPLYERTPGLFARQQMAAVPRLIDTAWVRDLGLEVLAS